MKFQAAGLILLTIISSACSKVIAPAKSETFVAPSHHALQYAGRWDRSDHARPKASWPGFSVATDFQGRSLKIVMTDAGNFYNVEVDGRFQRVVGGKKGSRTYVLADDLNPGVHRVRLQRRNISFDAPTVIEGFVTDGSARLTRPTDKRRRIEFIGDSYTAAEGNEATAASLPWREKFPVTNFDLGFAAIIGRALDAEVTAVCRSGSGVLCDWKGGRNHPMGERYDWTLMEQPDPPWNFKEPSPEFVVISLGLNDFSGLKGPDGRVSRADTADFRSAYRRLIAKIRHRHPRSRVVALASFNPWTREAIAKVVAQERAAGRTGIHYAEFDEFPGGYVADGHPTVETHRRMAAQILDQLARVGIASDSTTGRVR